MSKMRRKIIETYPESYTIKFKMSPAATSPITPGSIFLPSTTDETTGVSERGMGFNLYFNPYRIPATTLATSAPAQYPVQVDVKISDSTKIIYETTISQQDAVSQERPYIGFAFFIGHEKG
jgi:hypothetical protein